MPDLDIPEIQRITAEIIREHWDNDTIDGMRPSNVRAEVEKRMSLEAGELDDPMYKKIVKKKIEDIMEELENADEVTPSPEKPKKAKAEAKAKAKAQPNLKANAKAAKGESAKKTKKTEEKTASKAAKSSKAQNHRSASVIPTNSEGEADDKPSSISKVDAEREEGSEAEESPEPPKKKPKTIVKAPVIPKSETSKPASMSGDVNMQSPSSISDTVLKQDSGYKSESEISVLIDEAPKRSRKKKEKSESEDTTKKKGRKQAKELSKDEETIKRLKSLVVACGVRKVWAKEFKDLDKPSDQIRRLKQILADLGMTGRMSMEQAKAIREKRELAQELEDVQKFEQAVSSKPSKRVSRSSAKHAHSVDAEDEESEDGDAAAIKQRKVTARQSIMAFLGDQSDSD